MSTSYFRDVGPILQIFRTVMRGRTWNQQLRKQEHLSQRPYPKPELPGGPSHVISDNYYYTRDARRMVSPPIQLIDNTTKQLSSGESQPKASDLKSAPKPGNTYNWDE